MQTIELRAGSTFSFAGPVSNLSGTITWGLSASLKADRATTDLDTLTCTIAQDPDFLTNGLYNVSLTATSVQTLAWWEASKNVGGVIYFDLKFFNTAAPDPVLRSDTLRIKITPSITP